MVSVRITDETFDSATEAAAFRDVARQADAGGVVTFTGLMRGEGGDAGTLMLEHYPGFTEQEIERIADDAAARFSLAAIAIVHRVGRIAPGEEIVFVGTAARHRRQAFEACDYVMDYLKSAAPFWKQEEGPQGARWIEPREADITDRLRWET